MTNNADLQYFLKTKLTANVNQLAASSRAKAKFRAFRDDEVRGEGLMLGSDLLESELKMLLEIFRD